MAKQVGPFFITGTISGISFYKCSGQYLARRAAGPSKKQIQTSPHFDRTRRNLSEFAACSKDGAFLRSSIAGSLFLNDKLMYQRMTKLLSQLKNYDTISEYGQRRFAKALQHKEAKMAFCHFTFNHNALSNVLLSNPSVTQQQIRIPAASIVFPKKANKALITALRLKIDFDSKSYSSSEYTQVCLNVGSNNKELCLTPISAADQDSGITFYFIQIRFFNNELSLNYGASDCVGVIAIDPVNENKILLINGEILPQTISFPVKQAGIFQFTKDKITLALKEAPA